MTGSSPLARFGSLFQQAGARPLPTRPVAARGNVTNPIFSQPVTVATAPPQQPMVVPTSYVTPPVPNLPDHITSPPPIEDRKPGQTQNYDWASGMP